MSEQKQNNNNFGFGPKSGNKDQKENDKKPKFNITWIYGIIVIFIIGMMFFPMGNEPVEVMWGRFRNKMLKTHSVEKIIIVNGDRAEIYIKSDKKSDPDFSDIKTPSSSGMGMSSADYYMKIGSIDRFTGQMDEAMDEFDYEPSEYVEVGYDTRENHMDWIVSWVIFPLLLIGVWLFIFKRMAGGGGPGGQIFNIGKSRAKVFDKEGAEVKVDFKDVAGLEEAKVEIIEIVDFLKKPEKYTQLGGKIPKGALLVGPPGTGKTLLAKAVAGEAHVPFFSMSGSDFVEMFVGVGASRVRDLFKQAKEKAPCIIFIDEIDAIGRARGKNANFGSNDERENTLNQLLTEMDGFGTNSGVIILAATNRADILDRALMRAGRFDRQIHVELPDLNERKDIFKVHMRPLKKLGPNVNADFLAKQTPGFSGADIANVTNEAALIAARQEKDKVEKQDFLDAIDRIIGGLEKKNKIISPNEKRTIAFHEAGHATVSWILEHANPLIKVTIVPRGQALGAAWYLPEERQLTTKEQMLDEMCAALGGRAAEELFFGQISTGALNDLEKVTKQAYAMVSYFGMSEKIGNRSYYDSSGQSEYSFGKPYSDETARTIDDEVKRIIDESYDRAKVLLNKYKEGHNKLGDMLLDKEVLFAEDLENILGPRPNGKNPYSFNDEALENVDIVDAEVKKEEKIEEDRKKDKDSTPKE
ncbi:MAG: ATP-dependent zinc metalloprotease FtsH [Salinivirgaceae bacterium]|jgi:AFG3 family protein|nr:ATP-dependent zinc metalloprotease FtsH [Salinivirgaceae bacterium]